VKELHKLLRDLRKEHELKQTVVANYLGISQQAYSNYENGQRDIPVWAVVALAKYYKVSTDYLLGADTDYLGSTNLSCEYVGGVSMYDVLFTIQQFKRSKRKELLRYIKYLNSMRDMNDGDVPKL